VLPLDAEAPSISLTDTTVPTQESSPLDVLSRTTLPQNTNLSSSTIRPPIIRSIDKPSSSLPRTVTVSEDYLCASVWLRKVDCMRQHLKELYQDTIRIDNLPADAILDPGDYATLRKKNRSTIPVSRPSHFGAVIHMDIVFGPEVAIGNIHLPYYSLTDIVE